MTASTSFVFFFLMTCLCWTVIQTREPGPDERRFLEKIQKRVVQRKKQMVQDIITHRDLAVERDHLPSRNLELPAPYDQPCGRRLIPRPLRLDHFTAQDIMPFGLRSMVLTRHNQCR